MMDEFLPRRHAVLTWFMVWVLGIAGLMALAYSVNHLSVVLHATDGGVSIAQDVETATLVGSVWAAFFYIGNIALLAGSIGVTLESRGDKSLLTDLLVKAHRAAIAPLLLGLLATSVLAPNTLWVCLFAAGCAFVAHRAHSKGVWWAGKARLMVVSGMYVSSILQYMLLNIPFGKLDTCLSAIQAIFWLSALALSIFVVIRVDRERTIRFLDAAIARQLQQRARSHAPRLC